VLVGEELGEEGVAVAHNCKAARLCTPRLTLLFQAPTIPRRLSGFCRTITCRVPNLECLACV
jgi:hypothetical protein